MYIVTSKTNKTCKSVSLCIGGYLDWMKRSASFIYQMASRNFGNGDQKFGNGDQKYF
jgi:hypothetical protein